MANVDLYDGQITRHFNIFEFKCKSGNEEILLNWQVIDHIIRLQKFRDWYNRAMIITSGYRTVDYNNKIGGSPKSRHLQGTATDFKLPEEYKAFSKERQNEFLNNIKTKWLELCKVDGLGGGVGYYNTFVHLDSRIKGNYKDGSYAFWDQRD